jgi:hypothetical protein
VVSVPGLAALLTLVGVTVGLNVVEALFVGRQARVRSQDDDGVTISE